MADVLDVYDEVAAAVRWSFVDKTGVINPNALKTHLRSFNPGKANPEDVLFPRTPAGATLIDRTWPEVDGTIVFRAEGAADYDALRASLGELEEYLQLGLPIRWQPDGADNPQFLDVISWDLSSPLRGQGLAEEWRALRDTDTLDLTLEFTRQPFPRGAVTTVGPTTVPNDPADVNGRYLRVTNPGSAPAAAILTVTGDTGSKLQEVLVGVLSGTDAVLDDYEGTAGTHYCKLNASHDGWTIALSNDTATIADGGSSGGNGAHCIYATNPTVMAKRARASRTTKLDSFPKRLDVYGRINNYNAQEYVFGLRWGPSTADPCAYSLDEVTVDLTGCTVFGHVDVYLGRVDIPEDIPLGGIAFEIWARAETNAARSLFSSLSFVPVEGQAALSISGGSEQEWTGTQLATPVANPAGGTAGTPYPDIPGALFLDTTTDNAGTPPNTGLSLAAGHHKFTWRMLKGAAPDNTITFRIRNITDSATVVTRTDTLTEDSGLSPSVSLEFDLPSGANATGDLYQAQVDDPSATTDLIASIVHEFVPAVGANESFQADPERSAVEKLDSSGNLLQPVSIAGQVPLWLQPGENTVYVHYGDVKVDSLSPGLESKLTRDPSVTVAFARRDLIA